MIEKTFGSYITQRRLERDMTLRGFAGKLGISPVYMCNIEKDRRPAPSVDLLDKMAALLLLSVEDKAEMLDLAAKSQNSPSVAVDLPEYINERDIVRVALRTAKDVDATDEEWLEFIERLKKRITH
jgi:transcriptional regulator with XRE-family HTH domain